MPLSTRTVSPVDLSVNRIPKSIGRDELQCVANGTLANLIRQLSSLSKNAEQIFREVHREVLKIDHKATTLFLRVERLAQKVAQPGFTRAESGLSYYLNSKLVGNEFLFLLSKKTFLFMFRWLGGEPFA